jgi:heterotetrameric sarcosine oxidase gamma subunit
MPPASAFVVSSQELFAAVEVNGLTVDDIRGVQVACLRYFDPAGKFPGAVKEALGRPLPEPLRADSATHGGDSEFILAWRSPTESVLLSTSRSAFLDVAKRLASAEDGCVVDQTGGLCAVRVSGAKAADLLCRLGASASIPGLGEARSSRLAELPVLTLCVRADTLILLVERVYIAHLLGWISKTAADL